MEVNKTAHSREKAILVGVGLKSQNFHEIKGSLSELAELADTAGAEVVGTVAQQLPQWISATLVGSGKVAEIADLVEDTDASIVVVDHQLSGVQQRNLEKAWKVRVLDRNQLILDIFALRARTYEGKLQVELAQMLDQLPRMVGAWLGSLSRLGGGIGTRGPGETALEMDRRRINDRVKQIRKKLEAVRQHRAQHRQHRKKRRIPSFALIGYTNSGKSTLLNQLSHSEVYVQDQVFATLDPTTRKVHLPEGADAVVTDTVGFIRHLPPQLIEAFKATLEESAEADILLHIVDLSSPQMESQIETVDKLIQEFGWNDKPIIHVFNKVDKASPDKKFSIKACVPRVFVSALKGEGLDQLKRLMTEQIQTLNVDVELFFPKDQEYRIYELGRETSISRTEKASQGTLCYASLTPSLISRWQDFLVKK